MSVTEESSTLIISLIALITVVLVHYLYKTYFIHFIHHEAVVIEQVVKNPEGLTAAIIKSTQEENVRPTTKPKKRTQWKSKAGFTHPWLLKNLKGHPGTVLHMDFSANGKYLAATCKDGSLMLWDIRDLTQKEHKTLRVNLEFDHATFVAWSPDSKAFIIHTVRENRIAVYKIEKKKDGHIGSATQVMTFDNIHTDDVVGLSIASTGKFIISCSCKTDLVIWDLKGQVLERIDTYLMSTYSAKISPCGRYIAATGFTPDVKVMEVCFDKSGEYKQVTKAFELTGHSSGIYEIAFDANSTRIVTISKDGTWRLYYVRVNYTLGESPRVLETGKYTRTSNPPRIALSPNAEVLAVSVDASIEFYDTYSGKLFDTVENVFEDTVACMRFDSTNKYLYVCGDRSIRILHNVCGYLTNMDNCYRLLMSKHSSATVERLRTTIAECKETLAKFGNYRSELEGK